MGPVEFCPRCGAPRHYLDTQHDDDTRTVNCGECKTRFEVTPITEPDGTVKPWTPFTDRVQSALSNLRFNAGRLKQHRHPNTAVEIKKLADKIERHSRVLSDNRRETVYDATNRILEHTRDKTGGQTSEDYRVVEDAVEDILSTLGVPDRVVNE